MNAFFKPNEDFVSFGTEHLIVLGIILALAILFPFLARRFWSEKQTLLFVRTFALVYFYIVYFAFKAFDRKKNET